MINYFEFCHGLCSYCDAWEFYSVWVLVSDEIHPSFLVVDCGWVLRYLAMFWVGFEIVFQKKIRKKCLRFTKVLKKNFYDSEGPKGRSSSWRPRMINTSRWSIVNCLEWDPRGFPWFFRNQEDCRIIPMDQEWLMPLESQVRVWGWGSVILADQKTLGEGLRTKRPRMKLGTKRLNNLANRQWMNDTFGGSRAKWESCTDRTRRWKNPLGGQVQQSRGRQEDGLCMYSPCVNF